MDKDKLMAECRRHWVIFEKELEREAWGVALLHLDDFRRLILNEKAVIDALFSTEPAEPGT